MVRGVGNIRDIELQLPSIDGLEILQPRIEDIVEHPNDRVGGVRKVEWLVVPQRSGTFEIPSLTLKTFDPESERYETVRGPSLEIVAAGNAIAPR